MTSLPSETLAIFIDSSVAFFIDIEDKTKLATINKNKKNIIVFDFLLVTLIFALFNIYFLLTLP